MGTSRSPRLARGHGFYLRYCRPGACWSLVIASSRGLGILGGGGRSSRPSAVVPATALSWRADHVLRFLRHALPCGCWGWPTYYLSTFGSSRHGAAGRRTGRPSRCSACPPRFADARPDLRGHDLSFCFTPFLCAMSGSTLHLFRRLEMIRANAASPVGYGSLLRELRRHPGDDPGFTLQPCLLASSPAGVFGPARPPPCTVTSWVYPVQTNSEENWPGRGRTDPFSRPRRTLTRPWHGASLPPAFRTFLGFCTTSRSCRGAVHPPAARRRRCRHHSP